MAAPEPLPLETYALALAHLLRRRGEPPAVVLGAIHVSAEAFWQAEQHWSAQLAQSFVRRKSTLAMKFAAAFAEARREVGLLDPREGEAPFPAPGASANGAPVLPSYLLAGQAAHATPAPMLKPADPLRGTALALDLGPLPAAPLPFAPGAATEALPPPDKPAPPPAGPGTGTALFPDGLPGVTAIPWEAKPDGPASAHFPPAPSMSVEHYAALVAELTRHPPDPAAVLAGYGVGGADEMQRIDVAFAAHFAANAPLRAKYDALLARFASMMKG
jgi:hypothetical protein